MKQINYEQEVKQLFPHADVVKGKQRCPLTGLAYGKYRFLVHSQGNTIAKEWSDTKKLAWENAYVTLKNQNRL